jgi:P4 family phage/plasmid primase-like protien
MIGGEQGQYLARMTIDDLNPRKQWCSWTKTDKGKEPHQYSNSPETWLTRSEAEEDRDRRKATGIGFQTGGGIVGVDIDWKDYSDAKPFDEDSIPEEVRTWMKVQGGYFEFSPSGLGLRGFCTGEEGPKIAYERPDLGFNVEIYRGKQYVTKTDLQIDISQEIFPFRENILPGRSAEFSPARRARVHLLTLREGVNFEEKLRERGIEFQTRHHEFSGIKGNCYDYHGLNEQPCAVAQRVHDAHSRHPREASYFLSADGRQIAHCCFRDLGVPDATRRALAYHGLSNIVATRFPRSDSDNADRFVSEHGENLRYFHDREEWHVWDGTRWAKDKTDEVRRLGIQTARNLTTEAVQIEGEGREGAIKYAVQSESRGKIDSMIDLASSHADVSTTSDEFDADPWLLNVENGTIDLRTGILRPHRREDNLTKICSVKYDKSAKGPRWEKFLEEVFPDPEIISYLQRAIGYTLTGVVSEHCFFLLIGDGRNGKGTFLQTIEFFMGDYARSAKFDMFMTSKYGNSGPRDGIAQLAGARFVRASESEDGQRFAEAKIKELVAPDGKLTGSFLYQDQFEFRAQHKIFLATNHEPKIHGTDEAIWRRIHRINFSCTIPPHKVDVQLAEELRKEASGILNWALEGLRQWRKNGLQMPEAVQKANAEYRSSQNIVSRFFDACIESAPNTALGATEIYTGYKQWAVDNHEFMLTQTRFGKELAKLLPNGSREKSKSGWKYAGIRLKRGEF